MATLLVEDLLVHFLPAYNSGSLLLTFGTNLFGGVLPDEPGIADAVSAGIEYPGAAPEFVMGPRTLPAIAHPRLQIVTRTASDDYEAGRQAIEDIANALDTIVNQTINTTYYERVVRLQDPFPLHRDESRRFYFACNFAIDRTP